MTAADRKRLALLAASQAAHAIAPLLEFAHGEHDDTLIEIAGGEEVSLLLDAAKMTAEIVQAEREAAGHEADEDLNQVQGAIAKFLEGWA